MNPTAPSEAAPSARPLPRVFEGRYQLRRLLAASVNSDVYAAEHLLTRRAVAVKLPRPGSSPQWAARSRREMDVLALLRGTGVVEMLDAGFSGDDPYIVFEMLEGRTLDGILAAREKLEFWEVLELGVALARALEHCHERGVVHRDVKPSNLFVGSSGGSQLKLLDFGIAKILGEGPHVDAKLTQEHALIGTLEYMPPEALLAGEVDQRADIYGLGVTLYECLTGSVPFEGSLGEVLLKVSTTTPRPLSELRDDVPDAFAATLERCLRREAHERFSAMAEVRSALEACVSPAASGARAPGPARRREDATADARAPIAPGDVSAQRRYPRAPYAALARITTASGSHLDGRVQEVSEGGLQFVGRRPISQGEKVRLRFPLPATGRIAEVAATVRWNRAARGNNATGLEFEELPETARDELRRYVQLMS